MEDVSIFSNASIISPRKTMETFLTSQSFLSILCFYMPIEGNDRGAL